MKRESEKFRSQNRPDSLENAPDPTQGYARENPDAEAGMGRLDNNSSATPMNRADGMARTRNGPPEQRQINTHDASNPRAEGNVEGVAYDPDAGAPNLTNRPRYLARPKKEGEGDL
jgi:hypothetical protein